MKAFVLFFLMTMMTITGWSSSDLDQYRHTSLQRAAATVSSGETVEVTYKLSPEDKKSYHIDEYRKKHMAVILKANELKRKIDALEGELRSGPLSRQKRIDLTRELDVLEYQASLVYPKARAVDSELSRLERRGAHLFDDVVKVETIKVDRTSRNLSSFLNRQSSQRASVIGLSRVMRDGSKQAIRPPSRGRLMGAAIVGGASALGVGAAMFSGGDEQGHLSADVGEGIEVESFDAAQ